MPIIILNNQVGGQRITVSKEHAKEIAKLKYGANGSKPEGKPTDGVTFNIGTFQLKDIRCIVNENKHDQIKNEKYIETTNACKEYRDKIKNLSPLEKAERLIRTYCYICYRSRGNSGKVSVLLKDPLYSKLVKPLLEFYEKNPSEINAPKELYQDIFPKVEKQATYSGWKRV
jgi:hypothetical protein